MKVYESRRDAAGQRLAIVVSRFNHPICVRLLEGCVDELVARGADSDALHVAWVPGVFEIPQAARSLAASGRYDAIVTLGVVIRGGTPHFEYVCDAVTDGVREIVRDTDVPVAFGVLTCDDVDQALARAGGEHGNKGVEAALAAIEMAHLAKALRRPPEDDDRPRRPRAKTPRAGTRGPRARGRRS
jgi:6,7-dimethyl-8-ribityllumazine synthase